MAGRNETLVFRLAMLAGVLWVLDDAFWHREPRTAAGEHLISILVPVGLAAVAAAGHSRLRTGARAALAVSAGTLLIVAGVVDGVRDAAIGGLAGDDVTAILAALAGVVLMVQGAAVLWRSRRSDGTRSRRYLRRALRTVLAAVGAIFILVPVALAIVVNHKAREPVERAA